MLSVAHGQGGGRFLPHQTHIQFHADRKHEQANADLAQKTKRAHGSRRENKSKGVRSEQAEKGWPEQDTRDHFAHHRRQTEPGQDLTRETRRGDNRKQLQEEMAERFAGVFRHPVHDPANRGDTLRHRRGGRTACRSRQCRPQPQQPDNRQAGDGQDQD